MTITAEAIFDGIEGEYRGEHFHASEEEWNTLENPEGAVHETAGVLRMFRGGMSGPQISEQLNLPVGPQLSYEMQKALDQETEAKNAGLEIYDAAVKTA